MFQQQCVQSFIHCEQQKIHTDISNEIKKKDEKHNNLSCVCDETPVFKVRTSLLWDVKKEMISFVSHYFERVVLQQQNT